MEKAAHERLHPLDRRQLLQRAAALTAMMMPSELRRLAAAKVAITYWHHVTSPTEFAGLERVIRLFEDRHPAVAVTPQTIPNAEFMAKIVAAIVSGSPPDTTTIAAERFADLKAMDGLRDLTEPSQAWPRRTSFSPRAFDAVTSDGRVYGIPTFTFIDWTYYRCDWFDEAGIDQPPDTMEAFLTSPRSTTSAMW
jgi:multiple sugar transport system substrate-binding protein